MKKERASLAVTYSSGVICEAPDVLSTLAVFYDEIWFPFPYDLNPSSGIRTPLFYTDTIYIGSAQDRYREWLEKWSLLFKNGILNTLPAPVPLAPEDYYR